MSLLLSRSEVASILDEANHRNRSFQDVVIRRAMRWRKWSKNFRPERLNLLTTDKVSYAAQGTALTWTLNSLAASTTVGRQSTVVSNTSNLDIEDIVTTVITTSASAIGSSKSVAIYVAGSLDGTNYDQDDGAMGASDAGYTINSPTNLKVGTVLNCPTSSKVYNRCFPISPLFGGVVPAGWVVVACNDTNQSLNSTGNSGNYTRVQFTNG